MSVMWWVVFEILCVHFITPNPCSIFHLFFPYLQYLHLIMKIQQFPPFNVTNKAVFVKPQTKFMTHKMYATFFFLIWIVFMLNVYNLNSKCFWFFIISNSSNLKYNKFDTLIKQLHLLVLKLIFLLIREQIPTTFHFLSIFFLFFSANIYF